MAVYVYLYTARKYLVLAKNAQQYSAQMAVQEHVYQEIHIYIHYFWRTMHSNAQL